MNTEYIQEYFAQLQETISELAVDDVERVVDILIEANQVGKKIFVFGNGGSASTASHFACDLSKNTITPGAPRFKVIALNDNIPAMTAWANDTAYDNIYAEQLVALVEPGDVVIGISCSGNSVNVLNAIKVAQAYGAKTIAMTGDRGGKIKEMVDVCLSAPSPRIEQQEDIHLIMEHCICSTIRHRFTQEMSLDVVVNNYISKDTKILQPS